MKSYLRFLSRNKLYTAIEVVGLSLALAFVIVLSSYIVDDMSVNKALKDTDKIYLCHRTGSTTCFDEMPAVYGTMPEIESSCGFVQSRNKGLFNNGTEVSHGEIKAYVNILGASDTFFDFFTFPLSEGSPSDALASKNAVVISEGLANQLFPAGDAIGKTINVFEHNPQRAYAPEFADFDVDLIVTGIFKPFSKTIFREPDMIMRLDLVLEKQYEMYHGSMKIGEFSFIKVAEGSDISSLTTMLTEGLKKVAKNYHSSIKLDLELTPFNDIKKQDPTEFGYTFEHIRQGKLYSVYLIMCIFLTVISLLDYIVLTIAFSRFRLKEIATRQLLGTERKGIIGRCVSEAFILLGISCMFAILMAITFKTPVSRILGAEISPLTQLNEYMLLAGVITLMAAIASAVPSIALSSYNAINVIKGEARFRDKAIFGKIFIGFAGFLSITALSICFGITRQTRYLINQPLGYEIDNIVCIEYGGEDVQVVYNELISQSYIDMAGLYFSLPNGWSRTSLKNDAGKWDDVHCINGTKEVIDMLGIKIIEDYKIAYEDLEEGKKYVCQSSYEHVKEYMDDGILRSYNPAPLFGIVSDFKIGKIKDGESGKIAFAVIYELQTMLEWGGSPIVKVNIDADKAKQQIKDLLISKGIDEEMFVVTTLREDIEEEIKEEQNMIKLLTGFSFICILMTVLTIIGLSSYYTKTGEKDNAIRNVFGCSRKEMVRKCTLDFMIPVMISAIVAIPIAWTIIDSWLESYVIRCTNSHLIYFGAFAIVLFITVVSITLQAIRLMRTNPAEALKKE